MRIAFVGKGGSGKSTIAAAFSDLVNESGYEVFCIDADINMHLTSSLLKTNPKPPLLSDKDVSSKIKQYLVKDRTDIENINLIRGTTPPSKNSNFINLGNNKNFLYSNYTRRVPSKSDTLYKIATVGTYDSDGIGTSCYHGKLTVLENILSHTIDDKTIIVSDMVAGTDSFANTLHSQFDILLYVVEPTLKSIEVFKLFKELSINANVYNKVLVIGNKVLSKNDKDFICEHIQKELILGFVKYNKNLRDVEQDINKTVLEVFDNNSKKVLTKLLRICLKHKVDYKSRYNELIKLHINHCSKVKDLETKQKLLQQIDKNFTLKEVI